MQQLQSTYVDTDVGKIPNDWKLNKLKDITLKITDGTHKTPIYLDDGIPFLRVKDIKENKVNWNQVKKISIKEHQELIKRCKPEKGDILLSKNGTIGITKLVNWDKEFSIFVSLCLIKPNHSKINNEFLSRILKSDVCLSQMGLRAKQATVINLHLEEIRELYIPTPPVREQQKIASILTQIDELMQKTDQIIEYTQTLKKGLAQRLLTKGIGHTKFNIVKSFFGKNQSIPINWNIAILCEIARIRYGLSQPPREKATGIPMVRATNIKRGKIIKQNILRVEPPDTRKDVFLQTGDIIVVRSGVNTGDIGYVTKEFEGCLAGYDLFVTPHKNVDSLFLFYYLLSPGIQNYFSKLKSRVAQEHLNYQQVSQAIIYLPSFEEQKMISFYLTNIDSVIQSKINYKQEMDGLKKGLMQQLLTGKIRVKI